jgi:signal transduction histidine kinase
MGSLVYIRLIGYTAGTLLQLFWMVVILGYRRQRNFERVFFFLCLALFLFYGGSLLALNAQIHYPVPPPALQALAGTLLYLGLCTLPPILIHLHLEYANTRGLLKKQESKRLIVLAAYAPIVFFGLRVYPLLANNSGLDLLAPGRALGFVYGLWLAVAFLACVWWQGRFSAEASDAPQQTFHKQLAKFFLVMSVLVLLLHAAPGGLSQTGAEELSMALALLVMIPFAAMMWMVLKFNFLNIGRQKNLVYAVSITFLALLYLSLVRRVGTWLEPVLPPEATAAVLLFVLVVFIEPIQRVFGRRLQETAQHEMDRVQRLTKEIQEVARQGNLAQLERFIERRVKEQFEVREVRLQLIQTGSLRADETVSAEPRAVLAFDPREFQLFRGDQNQGVLHVEPHGATISGDTRAALEFLCEQLPGALDLCRLIEEKLQLERELAERERLAALGQMAASISHNLKNPLGSMKTILQVQLENPEMPESMRAETKMILEEIGRLSAKLNQLLQFSRPAVIGEGRPAKCDASEVAREVVGVLRPEAQRKGVALELSQAAAAVTVAIGTEGLNDILTNLVVNALDAAARGGHVQVEISMKDGNGLVAVEDDGLGVAAELREKILQPFFTTKTQGTGLGLAIVARRASEAGGKLEFESPVKNARGTRFLVWIPLGEEKR